MRGVLVVGASSPIGQAICASFAEELVVAVSLPPHTAAGQRAAVSLSLDCSTASGAEQAVAVVMENAGSIDVVVLAAAAMPVAPITDTTDEQWQGAMEATLGTAFAVSRAALPLMRPGSAIVAVSSVNGTLAAPGVPAYAAAKSGLEGLVRQVALEYGPRGIRVNAVAPGMIGPTGIPDAAAGYPLGRIGTPEEVAQAVHFLADATFVTGVVLPVDGGLSIASPAAFLRADLRARWLS
jgi:meso-butanediol dehydrogenase/(S,S)-butanediol dehydrogenase/diacetyl reductase